jgi:hypothetical protein
LIVHMQKIVITMIFYTNIIEWVLDRNSANLIGHYAHYGFLHSFQTLLVDFRWVIRWLMSRNRAFGDQIGSLLYRFLVQRNMVGVKILAETNTLPKT